MWAATPPCKMTEVPPVESDPLLPMEVTAVVARVEVPLRHPRERALCAVEVREVAVVGQEGVGEGGMDGAMGRTDASSSAREVTSEESVKDEDVRCVSE